MVRLLGLTLITLLILVQGACIAQDKDGAAATAVTAPQPTDAPKKTDAKPVEGAPVSQVEAAPAEAPVEQKTNGEPKAEPSPEENKEKAPSEGVEAQKEGESHDRQESTDEKLKGLKADIAARPVVAFWLALPGK